MWAEDATTGASASGSGTIAVTFNRGLAATGETIIDVVQLGGNNTTTPIVTASTATTTGSSTTATANLKQAPAASDAEAVFFGAQASLAAPITTLTSGGSYTSGSGDSAGFYSAVPAQLNSTFTLGSSVPWLTIALEIAHG
jgi:hypothetical protein